MKANYNVTGNDRKALVAAIEKLTGDKAVYMRMPTCAYEIGDITVDKEGSATCEDADKLERIIHSLIADGFTHRRIPKRSKATMKPPALQSASRSTRWRSETSPTSSQPRKASSKRHSALTTLASRSQRIRSASLGLLRCRSRTRSRPTPTSLHPLAR